jgi:hypothetical protein
MTTYYVATRARYVFIDAEDELEARERGAKALALMYDDLREQEKRGIPVPIHTVRPATEEETRPWGWYNLPQVRKIAVDEP